MPGGAVTVDALLFFSFCSSRCPVDRGGTCPGAQQGHQGTPVRSWVPGRTWEEVGDGVSGQEALVFLCPYRKFQGGSVRSVRSLVSGGGVGPEVGRPCP